MRSHFGSGTKQRSNPWMAYALILQLEAYITVNFMNLLLLRFKAPPYRVGAVEHQMMNTTFTT